MRGAGGGGEGEAGKGEGGWRWMLAAAARRKQLPGSHPTQHMHRAISGARLPHTFTHPPISAPAVSRLQLAGGGGHTHRLGHQLVQVCVVAIQDGLVLCQVLIGGRVLARLLEQGLAEVSSRG